MTTHKLNETSSILCSLRKTVKRNRGGTLKLAALHTSYAVFRCICALKALCIKNFLICDVQSFHKKISKIDEVYVLDGGGSRI